MSPLTARVSDQLCAIKQPTCLSSWLFLWSVLLGISFQIISIRRTFPWGNLKPVVNLHSRLKWRSLCPASPNTPSLTRSTAITFTCTRSTWNMTVRSLSPRWVHGCRSLLYNLAFRFFYKCVYMCAGFVAFFSSYIFFSYIPLQARNIAICIEFKDSDEEDSQPLKVCLFYTYTTHIYIICIYVIYLYFYIICIII